MKQIYGENDKYLAYAQKLAEKMAVNRRIVSRNKKIRTNLEQMVADAEQVFSLYQKKCAEREEKRIYFDHYRLKLKKLQEKAAERSNKPVTSTTYAFSSETKEH